MQDNPILVEVTRGGLVESCHRGAVAIADADGRVLLGLGDIERPVYPRSAVKALQAIPLIETGAADAIGLGQAELAIACASHSGDETHIDAVRALLAKAGLDESLLACGAHWPIGDRASRTAGAKIQCPLLVLWGAEGKIGKWYDPLAIWRQYCASEISGEPVNSGHYLASGRR